MIKSATIRGKRYKYTEGMVDGWCDQPESNHDSYREIWISSDLEGRDKLETICHEVLHALFPKLKEPTVLNAGRDMARLLWRRGYRLGSERSNQHHHDSG